MYSVAAGIFGNRGCAVSPTPWKNGANCTTVVPAYSRAGSNFFILMISFGMAGIILFNKPYGVLCQFTDRQGRPTLADYVDDKSVYAAGRLDMDSEGLVVLTDDGALQHKISDPKNKMEKTYRVQLEGEISDEALQALTKGIELNDGKTRPAKAKRIEQPANLWPRIPPIRERKNIPTSWIELSIKEGRNRQVRRMTAAVGFPTLRLIRYRVGSWTIDGISNGQFVIMKSGD